MGSTAGWSRPARVAAFEHADHVAAELVEPPLALVVQICLFGPPGEDAARVATPPGHIGLVGAVLPGVPVSQVCELSDAVRGDVRAFDEPDTMLIPVAQNGEDEVSNFCGHSGRLEHLAGVYDLSCPRDGPGDSERRALLRARSCAPGRVRDGCGLTDGPRDRVLRFKPSGPRADAKPTQTRHRP